MFAYRNTKNNNKITYILHKFLETMQKSQPYIHMTGINIVYIHVDVLIFYKHPFCFATFHVTEQFSWDMQLLGYDCQNRGGVSWS